MCLSEQTVEQVKDYLRDGYTHRRIWELMGGTPSRATIAKIDAGDWKPFMYKHEPRRKSNRNLEVSRCPTCGAKVFMPCIACAAEQTLERSR